ncbi:hypothetical protein BJY52DRAFT_1262939 [Lactarius psammicola]|nr:hypothetical protein BJY52DRAFT_1262939 [Lactarius psammicola]
MTVALSSPSPSFVSSRLASPLPILSTQTGGEKGATPIYSTPPPLCAGCPIRVATLFVSASLPALRFHTLPPFAQIRAQEGQWATPVPSTGAIPPCSPASPCMPGGEEGQCAPPSPLCLGYSNPTLACQVVQEGQCAPPTPLLGNCPCPLVYAPCPAHTPHLCACAACERKDGRTMRGREREPVTVRPHMCTKAGCASGAGVGTVTVTATQQQ